MPKNIRKIKNKSKKAPQKISILRLLLIVTITSAGLTSGGLSYVFIRNYQLQLYQQEFNNIVNDNFKAIQESLFIDNEMNLQVANIFGRHCSTSSHWPNCALSSEEFTDRANSLMSISQITQFVMLPIVPSNQQTEFEQFAEEYYHSDGGYSSSTGYSSFGFGIYSYDSNMDHVPSSSNHSSDDFFLPAFQISNVSFGSNYLMFDGHSDPAIGRTTDQILNCVKQTIHQHKLNVSLNSDRIFVQRKCSVMTDFIPTFQSKSSVIGTPIFPINHTEPIHTAVGISGSLFSWSTILSSTSRTDSTFQCTIQSTTSSVQLFYDVDKGVVTEKTTKKKRTEVNYDHFKIRLKKSFVLNRVDHMFDNETVYTITYYSSEQTPSQYLATLSFWCCIGVTVVISVIFLLFNILIKREAVEANVLLDSKRIFVRFISHEIRTPLNTVILGLRVLQENLTTIRKHTNILEGLIEESLNIIDDLDENSSIAVTTLNDLINYDKIETKTFTIEKKMVNVWSVVEKTVSLMAPQAKEKGVHLLLNSQIMNPQNFPEANLDLNTLRVFGDSMKLGQVIRNLVSNALKFTPIDGQVSISVLFCCNSSFDYAEDRVGHIVITVTDTGPGLSKEQQKVMFREGVQFNPNELQAGQGSGLGLWISREIVSLHDGSVSVKSDGLGLGSSFQVSLPVVSRIGVEDLPSPSNVLRKLELSLEPSYRNATQNTINPAAAGSSMTPTVTTITGGGAAGAAGGVGGVGGSSTTTAGGPSSATSTVTGTGGTVTGGSMGVTTPKLTNGLSFGTEMTQVYSHERHVLIVDDAASNRKIVSRILKSKGFICHEAENGLQCVEKVLAKEISFEFIVLDFEMPIMDGPSAARQLREKNCEVIIIGVTGNVLPDDRDYFMKQGVNAVFCKPVNIEELLNRVTMLQLKV